MAAGPLLGKPTNLPKTKPRISSADADHIIIFTAMPAVLFAELCCYGEYSTTTTTHYYHRWYTIIMNVTSFALTYYAYYCLEGWLPRSKGADVAISRGSPLITGRPKTRGATTYLLTCYSEETPGSVQLQAIQRRQALLYTNDCCCMYDTIWYSRKWIHCEMNYPNKISTTGQRLQPMQPISYMISGH